MEEADADELVAPAMGGASVMQMKIDEIKQGIGSIRFASGVAAQLAIGVIDIMLELLQTQGGDGNPCGDFFDR